MATGTAAISITTATMTVMTTTAMATADIVTAITTAMRSVVGTTIRTIICRQVLPREIDCPQDWKDSYRFVERCLRDCVRRWFHARWNSKGVCLRLRQDMETLRSAGTSCW